MYLPLDRDIPADEGSYEPDDDSPVDIPNKFKEAIAKALKIAEDICKSLLSQKDAKRSAVEFWCDTVNSLKWIERDISVVTDETIGDEDG